MFKSMFVQMPKAVQVVQVSLSLNLFVLKGPMSLGSLDYVRIVQHFGNCLSPKSHDAISFEVFNPLSASSHYGCIAMVMSQVFLYRNCVVPLRG